jgi:uncharacterized damage-inducible protein DinB
MDMNALLAMEYDFEMNGTRRVLERLPFDRLDFSPDPKSTKAGQLASHIASLSGWAKMIMTTNELDLGAMDHDAVVRTPKSREALLSEFDDNVKSGMETLRKVDEATLSASWKLRVGDRVVFTLPRYMVYRRLMLNHVVHHRAQLAVYLRLMGVPVPALFGPSADEAI